VTDQRQRAEPIRSASDALDRLDDVEYFHWCLEESRKLYLTLISKRFPQFVKARTPRS